VLNVRNFGNLVPAGHGSLSVESALEYAVGPLAVTSIAVCGHSGCEAMQDLLGGDFQGSIREWLHEGHASLEALRDGHPVAGAARAAGLAEADVLSAVNVATQLERLRRHPLAGPGIADGTIAVVGLYLDLPTARSFRVSAEEFVELACVDGDADIALAERG
jgi:carbonic anhydrase